MTQTESERYGLILTWAANRAVTGRPMKHWPGLPMAQIPSMSHGHLAAAIKDGKVTIVEQAATTDPSRTVSYVVLSA